MSLHFLRKSIKKHADTLKKNVGPTIAELALSVIRRKKSNVIKCEKKKEL
jgi:hypothetical protein